ncbi:MAG: oligosaccharide flippase family protein [Candidatus Kerfeldbacteria bacterium]|nr:oligosaccharide flippase family protein [Candidatus Kerfeldbacteria bacterium]
MSSNFFRGTISLSIATLFFFGVGYLIQYGIAWFVPHEHYGNFGTVLYFLSTIENIFVGGLSLSVSRFLAENPLAGAAIIRKSRLIQIIIAMVCMGALAVAVPYLGRAFHSEEIERLLWIVVAIIPFYSARGWIQGILGGQQEFIGQAKIKTSTGIVKLVLVFAALLIGYETMGVLFGYLLSGVFGYFYARTFVHPIQDKQDISFSTILRYTVSATIFLVVFPLFFNMDVFLVKSLADSSMNSDSYIAATTLARLPFYLFTGVLLTLLPSVSHLKETSIQQVERLFGEVLRYSLIFLLPMITMIVATAKDLLTLLYPDRAGYVTTQSVESLKFLIIGICALIVFRLFSTVVVGITTPHRVMGVTLIMIITNAMASFFLVPRYGPIGAAISLMICSLLGLLWMILEAQKHFHVILPVSSLRNIIVGSAVVGIVALYHPTGLLLIVELIALGGLYVVVLWMFREIQQKDISRLMRIIKRAPIREELA